MTVETRSSATNSITSPDATFSVVSQSVQLTADNVGRGELHAAKLSLGKDSSLSQMSFLLETDRSDRTNY